MKQRWPAIKITLVLLYLGVLPLAPDTPLFFAFALLALALVATVPVFLQFTRALCRPVSAVDDPTDGFSGSPGLWQLLRPVAPGTRGMVRSRAPSRLAAAHG